MAGDAVSPDLRITPLTSAQWLSLEDLFGRSGASNGCWCMYWRIGPRHRGRPREYDKCDLRELAESGQSPGLLAFDGSTAVGWCLLAPRAVSWDSWAAPAASRLPMSCLCGRSPASSSGAATVGEAS
jgi:hypothetical protein